LIQAGIDAQGTSFGITGMPMGIKDPLNKPYKCTDGVGNPAKSVGRR